MNNSAGPMDFTPQAKAIRSRVAPEQELAAFLDGIASQIAGMTFTTCRGGEDLIAALELLCAGAAAVNRSSRRLIDAVTAKLLPKTAMTRGENLKPVVDALQKLPPALDHLCERWELAAQLIPRDGSAALTGIEGLEKHATQSIALLERTIAAIRNLHEAVEQGRRRDE